MLPAQIAVEPWLEIQILNFALCVVMVPLKLELVKLVMIATLFQEMDAQIVRSMPYTFALALQVFVNSNAEMVLNKELNNVMMVIKSLVMGVLLASLKMGLVVMECHLPFVQNFVETESG